MLVTGCYILFPINCHYQEVERSIISRFYRQNRLSVAIQVKCKIKKITQSYDLYYNNSFECLQHLFRSFCFTTSTTLSYFPQLHHLQHCFKKVDLNNALKNNCMQSWQNKLANSDANQHVKLIGTTESSCQNICKIMISSNYSLYQEYQMGCCYQT